jgi:sporulation protein YlmC with PRC-barrel domain
MVSIIIGYFAGRYHSPNGVRVIDIGKSIVNGEEINWPAIDNLHLAKIVNIGGYSVLSPMLPKELSRTDNTLIIFSNNKKPYIEIDYNMVQVTINPGTPKSYYLAVIDLDRNGVYDSVQYDIFDNNGNVVGKVIDIDRDGQADIKTIRGKKGEPDKIYYFIDGNWYLRKDTDGSFIVTANGNDRKIIKAGRKFVFKQ